MAASNDELTEVGWMGSLVMNCGWYPSSDQNLNERVVQVRRALQQSTVVEVFGSNWFKLAGSKRSSLAKQVSMDSIADPKTWKRRRFPGGDSDLVFSVWNGRDEPEGVSLMVELHEPSVSDDSLNLSGPWLESLKGKSGWERVLRSADELACELGGICVVRSLELSEQAKAQGIADAEHAAYAVFWGEDASGRRPASEGPPGRDALIAAHDWEEAMNPDMARIQDLIRRVRGKW